MLSGDSWNPFREQDQTRERPRQQAVVTDKRPYLPPMIGELTRQGANASADPRFIPRQAYPGQVHSGNSNQPTYSRSQDYTSRSSPGDTQPGTAVPQVERGELAPVLSESSNLSGAMWHGLDAGTLEHLVGTLTLPSQSAELESLWIRLMQPDGEARQSPKIRAVRAEALFRSGKLAQASKALKSKDGEKLAPVLSALRARVEIILGNVDAGCSAVTDAGRQKSKLPRKLRGEIAVLVGFCAIHKGNRSAAGLAACPSVL